MTPMRQAIADNMVRSFYTAPHAYLVGEVDLTDLMREIAKQKEGFQEKHEVKLTITSFVVQSIAQAVKEFPLINASLEEEEIVIKKSINVGIAVAVDQGLVVPVIKRCQKLTLVEIAQAVADMSHRARKRQLKPDEVMEGSITFTNFGMSGALIGLPIIRYPEVAIIGMGAIQKRVAVFDNDSFGVRQIAHLTLSFDHRAVDGMYAGSFLKALQDALQTAKM
jgi:2-oxoglutarate dehydrogenase E2 component (dihydrolipoamide succinyltransferase)